MTQEYSTDDVSWNYILPFLVGVVEYYAQTALLYITSLVLIGTTAFSQIPP